MIAVLIAGGLFLAPRSNDRFYQLGYTPSASFKKIAVIFTGVGQQTTNLEYTKIGRYYLSKGITPIYVDIDWRRVGLNHLSETADQLGAVICTSFPHSKVYLFGFSFGAVMAYKVSERIASEQALLCSMSPVFDEDRKLQQFPFKQLLGLITNDSKQKLTFAHSRSKGIILLYGEHDSFLINPRMIYFRKNSIANNVSVIVKDAHHDVSGGSYLRAIKTYVEAIE